MVAMAVAVTVALAMTAPVPKFIAPAIANEKFPEFTPEARNT